MIVDSLLAQVNALWRARGGRKNATALDACPASGNNRLYIADGGDERIIVKQYFPGQAEQQDRLDAEWEFLRHAHGLGIGSVPRPIARDAGLRIGLYEFIDGRRLDASEVTADHVAAAADFIAAINTPVARASGSGLPLAREACFSLSEHVGTLERRLHRLSAIQDESKIDHAAAGLAAALCNHWQGIAPVMTAAHAAMGITPQDPIPQSEWILSPSDFGFHNALLRPDRRLAFIDFEYAGWDDVAKLAADYFYQPAIPVDRKHEEILLTSILKDMPQKDAVRRRIDILRPLFGLKWCCIMLNCFLPDMQARVQYADPVSDQLRRKTEQFEKAAAAFSRLKEEAWLT